MLARVSNIEAFRRWRLNEESTPEELVHWLTASQPTDAMIAGSAFHKALETAKDGEYDELSANGYTFVMADCELALPPIREVRASKCYGELQVTGKFDALIGNRIVDHKTTATFKPEGYMEGCQWRFYLDIFGASIFQWNVFELHPMDDEPMTYYVMPPHILTQYRYPGLHDDCASLASDFYDFAQRFMPEYTAEIHEAA